VSFRRDTLRENCSVLRYQFRLAQRTRTTASSQPPMGSASYFLLAIIWVIKISPLPAGEKTFALYVLMDSMETTNVDGPTSS